MSGSNNAAPSLRAISTWLQHFRTAGNGCHRFLEIVKSDRKIHGNICSTDYRGADSKVQQLYNHSQKRRNHDAQSEIIRFLCGSTWWFMEALCTSWEHFVLHENTMCYGEAFWGSWKDFVFHGSTLCFAGALCVSREHFVFRGSTLCFTEALSVTMLVYYGIEVVWV